MLRHKFICDNSLPKLILRSSVTKIRAYTVKADYAYVHVPGQEPLSYRNFGEQIQISAEKYGNRTALVSCEENTRLSFTEIYDKAMQLSIKLKALGLRPVEDHLGIWATNTSHWILTCLAAGIAGLPLVCLNPALTASELTYALKKARVKALVTMEASGRYDFHNVLKEVIPHLERSDTVQNTKLPELLFVISRKRDKNSMKAFMDFDDLLSERCTSKTDSECGERISPESVCNLQFTSGTTGDSKVVLLTHFNVINSSFYFGKKLLLHNTATTICLPTPLFHVFGLAVSIASIIHGSTIVLPSSTFDSTAILNAIEIERCETMIGTPTMFIDIAQKQQQLKRDISSLRCAITGGAACSPEIYTLAKNVLGLKGFSIGYGLSEATSAVTSYDNTEGSNIENKVGYLLDHGEAKITNEKGDTVKFGQPGELCVRGFFTMKGYYEDEEKTAQTFLPGGWLRTGDEFILESNGVLRCIGRKKELIIRGGENIYPKEIEYLLDTHPKILESQVIGVPDNRLGEEICVFLRLKSESEHLGVEDVKEFCKGKLAYFKIPRYIRIVDEFPKTTSGKIQKFKLLEMFHK